MGALLQPPQAAELHQQRQQDQGHQLEERNQEAGNEDDGRQRPFPILPEVDHPGQDRRIISTEQRAGGHHRQQVGRHIQDHRRDQQRPGHAQPPRLAPVQARVTVPATLAFPGLGPDRVAVPAGNHAQPAPAEPGRLRCRQQRAVVCVAMPAHRRFPFPVGLFQHRRLARIHDLIVLQTHLAHRHVGAPDEPPQPERENHRERDGGAHPGPQCRTGNDAGHRRQLDDGHQHPQQEHLHHAPRIHLLHHPHQPVLHASRHIATPGQPQHEQERQQIQPRQKERGHEHHQRHREHPGLQQRRHCVHERQLVDRALQLDSHDGKDVGHHEEQQAGEHQRNHPRPIETRRPGQLRAAHPAPRTLPIPQVHTPVQGVAHRTGRQTMDFAHH